MSTISCSVCGAEVETRNRRRIYCSMKCKDRGKPSAKWQGRINGTATHGTSSSYDAHGCRCDLCREAKRVAQARYAAKVKAERGISPSALYKRRASGYPDDSLLCIECGLPVGSSQFSRSTHPRHAECRSNYSIPTAVRTAVYDRDGLICHLCGAPCDPMAGTYDDDYPTLDHLIPRSRGGGHEESNLATAHRGCNVRRGNTPLVTHAA